MRACTPCLIIHLCVSFLHTVKSHNEIVASMVHQEIRVQTVGIIINSERPFFASEVNRNTQIRSNSKESQHLSKCLRTFSIFSLLSVRCLINLINSFSFEVCRIIVTTAQITIIIKRKYVEFEILVSQNDMN